MSTKTGKKGKVKKVIRKTSRKAGKRKVERQPVFTLYLPEPDRRRLLALCKTRDRSASYIFREWLHSIVEPYPKEPGETP